MANNQRRTAPGAVNKPAPFNKTPLSNQPRVVALVPPRPPQPPIPPRPPVQMKQVPTARGNNHGAGPHINQHSAHLQRAVQMKMNQTRGVNRVIAPSHARNSGVVQPACIADFFRAAWQKVSSCWNSAEDQQPLINRGAELAEVHRPRVEVRPVLHMVDQEEKIKNVAYPASVNAVLVAGCALVIFCGVDSFDCYHPSGGTYKGGHGLRNNPTRIYYVYRSLPTDSESFIESYHTSARRYQIDGGGAPLRVLGQRGVKSNIWVDVMSQNEIGPNMGSFI